MYDNENQGNRPYTDYVGYGPSTTVEPKKKDHSKGKKAVKVIALVMASVLFGGSITYGIMDYKLTHADTTEAEVGIEEEPEPIIEEPRLELKQAEEENPLAQTLPSTSTGEVMNVEQVASHGLPSVVAITKMGITEIRSMWGTYSQESQSCGSGVIIGETADELLILTNYHVIEGNESLSVVFSWEEGEDEADDADIIKAVVKDYDAGHDIAVISVKMADLSSDTKDRIVVATVGDSDKLNLGEQIVAIGNALGYGQSVTTGIVSAFDRSLFAKNAQNGYSSSGNSIGSDNKYIQTDAAINPGNSGGAMFNMRGELVGINSAKSGGATVEGMGYAIPISNIMNLVENMMNQETRSALPESERGYLGISIVDVTDQISQTYGLPVGVYVSSVEPGSGAEKAGLEKENIITGVNGKTVKNSAELKEYLSYYGKNEVVTLRIAYRTDDGYEEKDIKVTLGESAAISAQQSSDN